ITLQGILILRVIGTPTGADVLRSLQEKTSAWNFVQLWAQPIHDLLHRYAPLGQRLQYDEHEAAIGLAAAGKGVDVLDCRILPDDVDKFSELFFHQLEGDALIGLNTAKHQPDVLIGKETLRNYGE